MLAHSAFALDRCASLLNSYELTEKEKSFHTWLSIGDNSAPRQAVTQLRINTETVSQSIITQIMVAAHCDLPLNMPSTNRYWKAASNCVNARGEDETKLACNREAWNPS